VVATADLSRAHRQRRCVQLVDAQQRQSGHGPDDVDDRVDGADFVQLDLVGRHAVDAALDLGDPTQHRQAPFSNVSVERRRRDQALDHVERPMWRPGPGDDVDPGCPDGPSHDLRGVDSLEAVER